MEDSEKLKEFLDENFKKHRIYDEEHLIKELGKPFERNLKAVIGIFGRKTINYEIIEDIEQITNSLSMIGVGKAQYTSLTSYYSRDCFIIYLLEKERIS
jgi:hypothetical protein